MIKDFPKQITFKNGLKFAYLAAAAPFVYSMACNAANAAYHFVSFEMRKDAVSPQTDDLRVGVMVVFAKNNRDQIILTTQDGPLPVGNGISAWAEVRDGYETLDELEAASLALIEANDSVGLYGVRVIQQEIIDGNTIGPAFGSAPQSCDPERCVPSYTAYLGNSARASNAADELSEEFERARDLQAEFDPPEIETLGIGNAMRKAGKEFFEIPVVKDISDYLHREWGIG